MSKIFLTGASGFIGSHLLQALQDRHSVYCMQSDLMDFAKVKQELHDFAPHVIVHLAARTEVERSFYEQVSFAQINYVGSVNLIEAASELANLQNFVFASTMEVYGWQPISDEVRDGARPKILQVFDETTNPNPNAPYAVAKLAVEKYLEYMHRTRHFPFCALRQTNSYGRSNTDFFVTEQIISQMLCNPHEIKLGYKNPWRNFLYIDDLIHAWTILIDQADRVNDGCILTMGPNVPIRIADWADLIAKKLNWHGTIIWDTKPTRPGEIFWLNSDCNLVEKKLGWKPQTDYSTGLDRTIDIWRKKLTAEKEAMASK